MVSGITGQFIHSNFLDLYGEEREVANQILTEFDPMGFDGALISAYFNHTTREVTLCMGDTEIIVNLDEWYRLHFLKNTGPKPEGSKRADRDWREDVLEALNDLRDLRIDAVIDEMREAERAYNEYLVSPRKDMRFVSKMGNDLYKLRCRSVVKLMKLGIPEARAADLLIPFFHDRI